MPNSIHILAGAAPEYAAMLRMVLTLANSVRWRGWNTSILFLGPGPLEEEARRVGVPAGVIRWSGSPSDPRGAIAAWRWLRGQRVDVATVHHGGRAVRTLCQMAGARAVVQHLHSRILENRNGAAIRGLNFGGADAVIAVSEAVAGCLPRVPCEVIYPGIEVPAVPPPYVAEGPFRVGVLSRLVALKNVDCALRAVALVAAQGVNIELEIAGTGPEEATLYMLAKSLGIEHRVRFLGWREDVPALLRRWYLLTTASQEESFCMAALEAMAQARPVLASRVGGLPELVADGVTGFLFPAGDAQAMAERLAALAADRGRAEQMGRAGWHRARESFSAARQARRTLALYERLQETARTRPTNGQASDCGC